MFGPIGIGNGKEKIVAVADIDGASAAVALLRIGAKGVPAHILAMHRSALPVGEHSQEQSQSLVVLALADAAHQAVKALGESMRGAHPATLYVVARGPWINTLMLQGNESFENDKKITNSYVVTFAQKVLGENRTAFVEPPFEASISTIELNGYPTRSPVGKYARMIHATVLASSVESNFRASVEHALSNAFPGLVAVWRSHTGAALVVLRDIPSSARNCFLVDVSGEEIALTTLRKDTIATHVLVPEGASAIARKISARGLPEETFAMMLAMENETCSTEECKRISDSLAETEQWLVALLGERLAEMATPRRLPNALILLAPPEILPWLIRFFARIDLAQFTVTTLPFSVSAVSEKDFSAGVMAETVSDIPLLLACSFVHSEQSR